MNSMVRQLLQALAEGGLTSVSKRIGADEKTTETALTAVVPLLLAALAKNSSKPEGASSLQQALINDHDGSILNDLGDYLNNPESANGDGILRHIFGERQSTVTRGLASGTNLEQNQVGELLRIAAPLVMGMLGRQSQPGDSGGSAVSALLGAQTRQARRANPGLLGKLNMLLDADGDGSAVDDIIGMIGRSRR